MKERVLPYRTLGLEKKPQATMRFLQRKKLPEKAYKEPLLA